ncbi:hypothetical protein L249_6617 [Ophiocordyceps polyrhachis-furcata BCC 54312]|uniref:Uncharacterized protein n=1 Tax=Ophiocordyceps polyrhachis-furcata BCC 54312 TaxID=1330021 RepID=A0A367LLW5_9HYPO|nr:hypothetical protein L249_6617 [Ophiocordyceps polyrhachis-furcata BCC 54312]
MGKQHEGYRKLDAASLRFVCRVEEKGGVGISAGLSRRPDGGEGGHNAERRHEDPGLKGGGPGGYWRALQGGRSALKNGEEVRKGEAVAVSAANKNKLTGRRK